MNPNRIVWVVALVVGVHVPGLAADFITLRSAPRREYDAAYKEFKKGLREKEPALKQAAIRTFAGVQDARVIKELKKLLTGPKKDAGLRPVAAQALSGIPDKRAVVALFESMSANSRPEYSRALAAIITGLGKFKCAPAAEKIWTLLNHSRAPEVKKAALGAMAEIVPAAHVHEIIIMYAKDKKAAEGQKNEEKKKVLDQIVSAEQKALKEITGESFATAKEYWTWWKLNRGLFKKYGGLKDGATPKGIDEVEAKDEPKKKE